MRILMLCTKYPLEPSDRYLTNDLARALVARGHEVSVVVTEWGAGPRPPSDPAAVHKLEGVEIVALAPLNVGRAGSMLATIGKWTFSSFFALQQMRRVFGRRSFDLVIAFTPCVTLTAQLLWVRYALARSRMVLFVHDFFPYHHRSIGLLGSIALFQSALLLERILIRAFDAIACTWPGNIAYLQQKYWIRPEQKLLWIPLWSDIAQVPQVAKRDARTRHELPASGKIVVFGGQITEGRGISEMLDAAALAKKACPDLHFLFVGDGRLVPLIRDRIAGGLTNVIYRPGIPRDKYLDLLAACDLGLICTVPQVASFAFPTKTIDYLRAGLPIVAAVEEQSDYRDFIDRWQLGTSVAAGDGAALFEAVYKLLASPRPAEVQAGLVRSCLEEVFDVRHAADQVLAVAGDPRPSEPAHR
jgi:glycosyltransferase involved in cell wall biosynthesis